MTNDRRVLIHPDLASLTGSVAARFLTKLIDVLDEEDEAHIVLTGGTVGAATQRAIRDSSGRDTVEWERVHFWWGDERFLPAGHADRNDVQAREALLDALDLPDGNVHAFPSSDEVPDIDEAALVYAGALAEWTREGRIAPRFDITFLGVGPDGHIASLFPDREGYKSDKTVIAVRDAPKPPPERLSLTLPVINSSDRVWMVLAGTDKASALGLALAGASVNEVPASGVCGRKRTVFFIDRAAARDVPEGLIASTY